MAYTIWESHVANKIKIRVGLHYFAYQVTYFPNYSFQTLPASPKWILTSIPIRIITTVISEVSTSVIFPPDPQAAVWAEKTAELVGHAHTFFSVGICSCVWDADNSSRTNKGTTVSESLMTSKAHLNRPCPKKNRIQVSFSLFPNIRPDCRMRPQSGPASNTRTHQNVQGLGRWGLASFHYNAFLREGRTALSYDRSSWPPH